MRDTGRAIGAGLLAAALATSGVGGAPSRAAGAGAGAGAGAARTGPPLSQVAEIPAYKDIFLAGRDYPDLVRGPGGTDPGGRSSPVRLAVAVPAGSPVTVSARFSVAAGPAAPQAPDAGGLPGRALRAGPGTRRATPVGLSAITAPPDGLVGVFAGDGAPRGPVPPALDFSGPAARAALAVRPLLRQVFYVGRGLGAGGRQVRYLVPRGARFLYLAALDQEGGSHDNHGTILATVTGLRTGPYAPPPPRPRATATATLRPRATPARAATRTATATAGPRATGTLVVVGQYLPTATASPDPSATATRFPSATGTATPLPTATLPAGFSRDAQGHVTDLAGQVVSTDATGRPVDGSGRPIDGQGQPLNPSGTPVNTLGTPVNTLGTPVDASGSPLPSATPSATPGPPASATPGPGTPSATPSAPPGSTATPGPTGTPFGQPIGEAWEQYQADESRAGYQAQDTGRNTNALPALPPGQPGNQNDPVADPASALYAGNLKLNWASPALNGNAAVNGGPVLGLQGLYYTAGDGSLRCVFANAVPDLASVANNAQAFRCPSGISAWTATTVSGTSLAANAEDDPPAVIATQNTLYFLSHNNPNPSLANVPGPQGTPGTGSLTAYNASTGARLNYLGNVPLHTGPFTPLAVHVSPTTGLTTCYVPTIDPVYSYNGAPVPPAARYVLHYLNCGPIGDGTDRLYVAAGPGTPTPTAPPTALIGPATPFPAPQPTTTGAVPDASQLQGVPTTGATVDAADTLVLVAERLQDGSGLLEAFYDADASPSTLAGMLRWSRPLPAATTSQPILAGGGAGLAAGEVVVSTPAGVRAFDAATGAPLWTFAGTSLVSAAGTDTPAYNPDTGYVYVGLAGTASGTFYLAALKAGTGALAGLSQADGAAITGAPVTDTGIGAPATPANARSVVFYVDAAGAVVAADAVPSGTAAAAGTLGNIPLPGVNGVPGVARPGASLVVANGHLYFGNTAGRLYDFSF